MAVAFFGDGALEEGHVHESLNLAALYRLPVIFVCENNLYASHLHWSERRVATTWITPASSIRFRACRWTATTSSAVYAPPPRQSSRRARAVALSFLECRTFRWRGHVGASFDLDVGREAPAENWPSGWSAIRSGAAKRNWQRSDLEDSLARQERIDPEIVSALWSLPARLRRRIAPRSVDHVWSRAEAACAR